MAMGVYAPIQAIMLLRRFYAKRSNHGKAMLAALIDALRSSTFLGAFIALFYYGVCLSRTRLGPKIVSYKTITPQMWDGGLCILGGCAACGWSIFCEVPRRQTELALFVVPRAIAAWFPRRYDRAVSICNSSWDYRKLICCCLGSLEGAGNFHSECSDCSHSGTAMAKQSPGCVWWCFERRSHSLEGSPLRI